MKKEEILEKSKSENLWDDERGKHITRKSESFAAKIEILLLLMVILWKQFHDMPYNDLAGIFLVQFGASIIYKYKNKAESKVYLVAGTMILFAAIGFLLDFFINGAG